MKVVIKREGGRARRIGAVRFFGQRSEMDAATARCMTSPWGAAVPSKGHPARSEAMLQDPSLIDSGKSRRYKFCGLLAHMPALRPRHLKQAGQTRLKGVDTRACLQQGNEPCLTAFLISHGGLQKSR